MPDLADAIKASGNEALATAFVAATKDVQNLQGKPSNSELLELYGLFKQAYQNPTFEDAPKPGSFAFEAKAKYNSWKAVVDRGLTAEDAQKEYVELVEKLKGTYGF